MKIEDWMGAAPRSGAVLLKPESDHLINLFKSGKSIDEIAIESMRESREVHIILLQNNQIYRQFVTDNQHNFVLSAFNKDLSVIFKMQPDPRELKIGTASAAIMIYCAVLVAVFLVMS